MRKVADGLIGLSAALGALGLLVEVVVILTDVIGRAFGAPLFGSQDIITMAMVILVFGAMALCDRKGGHIAVDLFEKFFPSWLNRAIDIAAALIGAVIFFGLAWAVNESAKLSVMLNLSTNLLELLGLSQEAVVVHTADSIESTPPLQVEELLESWTDHPVDRNNQ